MTFSIAAVIHIILILKSLNHYLFLICSVLVLYRIYVVFGSLVKLFLFSKLL